MPTELYGLQVDFVTSNGHFMVLTSPNGLKREQLSDFQVNMLLTNKIPQILELQVEERDQAVKLYYNITGKRMLTHWLRTGNLSIKQFFSLLYQIVEIVSASNVYMLQEGMYILKEDYIYCNEDGSDIHLTYIPKDELTDKNSLSADLQLLSSRLVHKVSELSGRGYQELMNYLLEESFNLPMLKQLLLKHMNDSGSNKNEYNPQPKQPTVLTPSAIIETQLPWPKPLSIEQPAAEKQIVSSAERHKKLKLPVLLTGFLGLCLIWKLYMDKLEEAWLWICSGLTLTVVYLVFLVLWKWNPPVREEDALDFWLFSESEKGAEIKRNQPSDRGIVVPFFKVQKQEAEPGQVISFSEESEIPPDSRLHRKLSQAHYQSLPQHTTMLSQPDRTVLLSQTDLENQIKKASTPYLEWTRQGENHKRPIDKSSFVIGRAGQNVNLEHNEDGVSRFHAEIVKENEQFKIKDLGSRNGTCKNEEILVPYRMYSLQEGDIVKIINTEFIFKMGL